MTTDLTKNNNERVTTKIPPMCKMTNTEINKMIENHICPDCGARLNNGGNCYVCSVCGWSKC